MKVPQSTSNFPILKPGAYPARIIGVLNAGTQDESFQGVPKRIKKIILRWEFPTQKAVFKEGGKPESFVVSAEYTFSLNLRSKTPPKFKKLVEALRGRPFQTQEEVAAFDPERMLGFPCMVMVGQKVSASGSTYNTIEAASPMDKNQCPPATIPFQVWEPEHGNNEVFTLQPPWVQDTLAASEEFKRLHAKAAGAGQTPQAPPEEDPQPEAPPDDWNGGAAADDEIPF